MKILLPVDGTELSLHETRFALRLVREGLRASFVLANVQEPASFYEIVTSQNPGLIESAAQEAGEDLIAPSARLLAEAGVPFETAVITGDPAHAMLDLIELHGCDMVVLANARMLGANARQLMRHVYVPSAMSWVFSSLHTSVGLAFVGAVVGEYLGSASGVGYLILQAEGSFDINTVFAGIVLLTVFALVLDGLVGLAERHLMKWQPSSGQTEKL